MKRVSSLLALGAIAIVAALAALNWPALMVSAPLNLVVAQVQIPLGAIVLVVAAALVVPVLVAYLYGQIGALLETRKLLREIQRVQQLADGAEASRVEGLRQLIATEFGRISEQLTSLAAAVQPANPVREGAAVLLTKGAVRSGES